eukprot:TRINITY_DN2005_c0_g1_i1.p4 TRINITY_DN2005_c0_g1~~TRINITY_DN2005_c0_g1_i1.p4  ORF type:complete len:145 (+),score=37.31 TRINITY_DN2005_c0_g1_i1:2091-2525(+)
MWAVPVEARGLRPTISSMLPMLLHKGSDAEADGMIQGDAAVANHAIASPIAPHGGAAAPALNAPFGDPAAAQLWLDILCTAADLHEAQAQAPAGRGGMDLVQPAGAAVQQQPEPEMAEPEAEVQAPAGGGGMDLVQQSFLVAGA